MSGKSAFVLREYTNLTGILKLVLDRAKVQLLCKNSSPAVGGNVKSIHDLSCLASSLFEEAVAMRNSTHANDKTPEVQMILLLHDAIYHQSQITLHSLVVPVFSRVPAHLQTDTQTQKKSAEAVIRHAELFETLLKPYLYGRGDVSRLPPLVGYGAFVVATVFLSAEVCWHKQSDSELFARIEKGSCRLDAAVAISHLLRSLKIYWRALESPVSCKLAICFAFLNLTFAFNMYSGKFCRRSCGNSIPRV